MPKYKLVVSEVYDVWYEVEGADEEEAWENYYEGDMVFVDKEFSHTVDDSADIVENLDEPLKAPKVKWDSTLKKFRLQGDEEDIL
jgi:hypothetical protein